MTDGNTSTATRCPTCGRRSVSGGLCTSCGVGLPPLDQCEFSFSNPSSVVRRPGITDLFPGSPGCEIIPAHPVSRTGMAQRDSDWIPWRRVEISGRAIIVRQAPHEPMDLDPWRWLAIPVWGLVLLVSPVALAIVVWQTSGFPPALGVAAVSLIVLRYLFSDRLLQTWHLTAALNGRHIVEPMPVLMARLQCPDEREIQLRLKGHLAGGVLMEGDRIRAIGNYSMGVLKVKRIVCERTGATIVPSQPNARNLAIIGVCALTAAILWLFCLGIPWVMARTEEFRASFQPPVLPHRIQLPTQ